MCDESYLSFSRSMGTLVNVGNEKYPLCLLRGRLFWDLPIKLITLINHIEFYLQKNVNFVENTLLKPFAMLDRKF